MAGRIDLRRICPQVLAPDGKLVNTAEVLGEGSYVGLYFSASWCPPCRGFTPKLAATYQQMRAAGKPFHVIFVSSDRDEGAMKEYFGHMPWHAVPYESPARLQLPGALSIVGIPTLAILGPDGTIVATNARSAVLADPRGEKFPWTGAGSSGGRSQILLFLLFILTWWLVKYWTGNKAQ